MPTINQQPKPTRGPIDKVPCPWCQQLMDFRPLADEESGGTGWGSQGFEPGATIACDHCGKKAKIAAVQKTVQVTLHPTR